MKLAAFLKALNTQDIKLAKRFQKHVRELEEESKGNFIAFVDDGKESFDVAIELTEDRNIVGKRCDCPLVSPFCCHINAVCLSILDLNKPKKKPRKKKPNKFEEMVANENPKEVLDWLSDQMKSDKLLAKKFEIDFVQKESLSLASLKEIHQDLLKSVNGRKKTISAVNAGKVIKLYEPIHDRVFNKQIQNKLANQEALDLIIEMRASIVQLHYMSKSSGKRIIVYLNKLQGVFKETITLLDSKSQSRLIDLFYEKNNLSKLSLTWVVSLLVELENTEDNVKKDFIKYILETDASSIGTRRKNEMLFRCIQDSDFIEDVIEDFPLEPRQNEYNLELVEKLSDLQKYESVVEKSLKVIERSSSYYGYPFFINLINALYELKDNKRLFEYGKKYFRDFATLKIYQKLTDIAPNKAELNEIYRISKNIKPFNFHDKNEAALILMAVYLDHDKTQKVFEIMQRYEAWVIPPDFCDQLIKVDRNLFASIFLQIGNRFIKMEEQYYGILTIIMMKHFSVEEIGELRENFGANRMINQVLSEAIMSLNS